MKNFKNIAYSLVALISLSLISAGAYAGGISLRIGGYGHGYHVAYNNYYPSAYYGYHAPVVTYRHHYRPHYRHHSNSYYSGPGYAHHSKQGYRSGNNKSYGRSSHHDRRDNYQSGHGRNRVAHNRRH